VKEFDAAIARIEQAVKAAQEKNRTPIPIGEIAVAEDGPKPVLKPRRIIKPAELVETAYIETPEAANDFADKLRDQLLEAIKNGERVEIR
jgi:O-acetyl-ADP-ribose deacetylase (regulator of RNase III)